MASQVSKNFKDKKGITPFPDVFASDSVKDTEEYGLQWAQAIEAEWFQSENGRLGRYQTSRQWYDKLRSYARGEQDTSIYERLLGITKDERGQATTQKRLFTNYDLRPIQVIPKFVKLLTNQMSERLFEVSADAIDSKSQGIKKGKRDNLERLRVSKPIIKGAKEHLNIDMAPGVNLDDIPDTEEEVDMRIKMGPKLEIEIAEEEALKFSLKLSDYTEISNRVIEDIAVLGKGVVKHKTDIDRGVIAEYVDVADFIHSYPTHRNYADVNYFGEIKHMNITEVERISRKKLSKDELQKMSAAAGQYPSFYGYSNDNYYRTQDMYNTKAVVLHFTFLANNHLTYKKKYNKNGGYKMIPKDNDFKKTSEDYKGYDAKRSHIEVWYEGYYVLGAGIIFNYGKCENMVRPEGDLRKTFAPYIVYSPDLYQNRSKSIVSTIIPYVDQMQQIHIKLQQFIAKAKPPGINIDLSAIESLDLGNGNSMTFEEYIRFTIETGNTISRSINEEGEYNVASRTITNVANGFMGGINELVFAFNHYMNLVRDSIGIPIGADASSPHPDMAVGVQQQLALNSNTATRHILEGSLNITQRLCTAMSLRMKDVLKYPSLRSAYERGIGTYNVEVIEHIKDLSLRDFAIFITLKPDAEEKQYLETAIQIALQGGLIDLSDAIDIRKTDNIKYANEVLKMKMRKKKKELMKEEEQRIMMQSEANSQSAERAAKAKMEENQLKSQTELEAIKEKTEGKIRELEAEGRIKIGLMDKEFGYQMQLKGIEVDGKVSNERMKEDEKTKRQDRKDTHQSAMINQRNTNSSPLNFESNEDHISGNIGFDDVGNF